VLRVTKIARQFHLMALHSRAVKPGQTAIARMRSTLAFTLMLWCAGAGCMLVSYAHIAAMSGANFADSHSNKRKLSDVSASAGGHACCKARHSSSRSTAGQRESDLQSSGSFLQVALPRTPGATSCCPLTSGSFVTASRAESNGDSGSATDQSDSFSLTLSNSPGSRVYPLRLTDQNQTYLRGCVFLI
jgi:hypothetical protein